MTVNMPTWRPLTAKTCMVPLAMKASSMSCGVFSRVPRTMARTVAARGGSSSMSMVTAAAIQSRVLMAEAMMGEP